ncbi:hypothetical protein [Lacipirellula parvula]|uniref:Uncharacterized protein n=1 Tax=Lacipirellula parvula TaxID=2650471 RepID=A0A5K7X9H3_9BACT|nr:hypothetical protein [Lacipirellula parvula]BBO33394.1 hypothetical protein PLANPX_3006 [Lacipirellula parvula]
MSIRSPLLTYDSFATLIAWISTCLLAAGLSMLFSDHTRWVWTWWGCFGLTAALGLDVAARMRAHKRHEEIAQAVQDRFERELGGAEQGVKYNRRSGDPR